MPNIKFSNEKSTQNIHKSALYLKTQKQANDDVIKEKDLVANKNAQHKMDSNQLSMKLIRSNCSNALHKKYKNYFDKITFETQVKPQLTQKLHIRVTESDSKRIKLAIAEHILYFEYTVIYFKRFIQS